MQTASWIPKILWSCLAVVVIVSQISIAAAADNEKAFSLPPGERQLFLDDVGIGKIENLKRTMHSPAKKGAVIRPDWPAGKTSLQVRSGPFWDPRDNIFKFWLHTDHLLRTSQDGLHWTLAPDKGSKAPSEVFYDPIDPNPARRYKSFSPGKVAVSPDGKAWTVLKGVTVPSSDEFNFSLDEKARLYIATVKHGGPYGRAVHLSVSATFEHWTKPELIFHADELDQKLGRENIKARMADPTFHKVPHNNPATHRVDVYNMGVFRYEGLYVGVPAMYHAVGPVPNYPNTVGFQMLQLACSRDLKSWKRLGERKAFIPHSPVESGAYDLTQMIGPSHALLRGPDCPADARGVGKDELWFYYTALKYRGSWTYVGKFPHGKHVPIPGLDKDTGAISLAVLRRDGFISLDAGKEKGMVLTDAFKLSARKLFVNVDAIAGELLVEVVGADGKVLAASAPMKGDLLRDEVKWQQGNVADLAGQTVRLRFTLRNASLYSYWLA